MKTQSIRGMALFVAASLMAGSCMAADSDSPTKERVVSDFQMKDFRGKSHQLSDYSDSKIVVLAFLGTECPLAKLYAPKLQALHRRLSRTGGTVIGIASNRQDSVTELAAFASRQELTFPLLKDLGNRLADEVNARRTPEVVVLDAERKVRYQGRIDDQYGVGYARDFARETELKSAIDSLLVGRPVAVASTDPVGCSIGRVRDVAKNPIVTYSNQISRILKSRCVECHRDGEIAPFALTEYSEVAGWAEMIAEVVDDQRMPPWHASKEHGVFSNERRLTDKEKKQIFQWVADGAPEGDPKELPEPAQFVEGWQLPKEPDYEAKISRKPFTVKPVASLRYQYFQLDPGFKEDKWIKAIELRPGNRKVVHHILMLSVAEGGDMRALGGGATGFEAAYIPGQRVTVYPEGMAKMIPAGSKLIFQVHYTPVGTLQTDHSSIGMVFADPEEVTHEVITVSTLQQRLNIPPNERSKADNIGNPSKVDYQLLGFMPHMHLRGAAFRYTLKKPDAADEVLLDIPEYDFNWQTYYELSEPINVPAGSQMYCEAVFDNTEDNLANPKPDALVRWGDQTWEEMMIGYFDVAVPRGQDPGLRRLSRPVPLVDGMDRRVRAFLDRYDKNGDDKVEQSEVPKNFERIFKLIDNDSDGVVTIKELNRIKSYLN